jgi:hypothetical protein
MWSSWTESAKSSLTQALEKTGDVISRTATDAGKAARGTNNDQQPQPTIVAIPGLTTTTTSDSSTEDGSNPSDETTTTTPSSTTKQPSLLPSRMMNMMMMKGSKTDETTEAAATSTTVSNSDFIDSTATTPVNTNIMKNFVMGWNAVVETTKASVKVAESKVKEQQQYIQQQLSKVRVAYYKRDPNLPLDVVALKDAEVVYITDRLITMGHPASTFILFFLLYVVYFVSIV